MPDTHRKARLIVITVLAHGVLAWVVKRPDLTGAPDGWTVLLPAGLWALLTWAWVSLARIAADDHLDRTLLATAIVVRVVVAWALPNLSDDVYRYVWDGRLVLLGLDPYAHTPQELWNAGDLAFRDRMADLYGHLNSQGYHTVYPPLAMVLFGAAAWMGDLAASATFLGLAATVADVLTLVLLDRTLRAWALPRGAVWWFALHPLVIVEHAGNVHLEAWAVLGLALALWGLTRQRHVVAALGVGFAGAMKLVPLVVTPFFTRSLGGWRRLGMPLLVAATVAIPWWLALDRDGTAHVAASLRLYTRTFEFAAPPYRLVRWLTGDPRTGAAMAWLAGALIVAWVLSVRRRDARAQATQWIGALAIYQLCATTVHPWYLTPLVALASVTGHRAPLAWGVLAPVSYATYWNPDLTEPRALEALALALTGGVAAIDGMARLGPDGLTAAIRTRPWVRRLALATLPPRLAIKRAWVEPLLPVDAPILDVGIGNGALHRALREAGFDVTGVDVADRSWFPDTRATLYDGRRLPFDDGAFDTVMLVTVLHHTPDPDAVLAEARRVARRQLVVMEDVHTHAVEQRLTAAMDALVNLELDDHPHTNRTDAAWRATFEAMGLQLVARQERRTLWLFRQVVYLLRARGTGPGTTLR